jgi:hypothetical protein
MKFTATPVMSATIWQYRARAGFGHLIKDFDAFTAGGLRMAYKCIWPYHYVNKRPGLSTRTVDSQRHVHGSLHEKAVQDGSASPS